MKGKKRILKKMATFKQAQEHLHLTVRKIKSRVAAVIYVSSEGTLRDNFDFCHVLLLFVSYYCLIQKMDA